MIVLCCWCLISFYFLYLHLYCIFIVTDKSSWVTNVTRPIKSMPHTIFDEQVSLLPFVPDFPFLYRFAHHTSSNCFFLVCVLVFVCVCVWVPLYILLTFLLPLRVHFPFSPMFPVCDYVAQTRHKKMWKNAFLKTTTLFQNGTPERLQMARSSGPDAETIQQLIMKPRRWYGVLMNTSLSSSSSSSRWLFVVGGTGRGKMLCKNVIQSICVYVCVGC